MSGEGYKPSEDEEINAMKMMNDGQKNDSAERQKYLEEKLAPSVNNLIQYIDQYNEDLSYLEERSAELPPEWIENFEKARKIQKEVREKLRELRTLFKLKD